MTTKIYAPASKKQELFLNSSATITIAGGAAKPTGRYKPIFNGGTLT